MTKTDKKRLAKKLAVLAYSYLENNIVIEEGFNFYIKTLLQNSGERLQRLYEEILKVPDKEATNNKKK